MFGTSSLVPPFAVTVHCLRPLSSLWLTPPALAKDAEKRASRERLDNEESIFEELEWEYYRLRTYRHDSIYCFTTYQLFSCNNLIGGKFFTHGGEICYGSVVTSGRGVTYTFMLTACVQGLGQKRTETRRCGGPSQSHDAPLSLHMQQLCLAPAGPICSIQQHHTKPRSKNDRTTYPIAACASVCPTRKGMGSHIQLHRAKAGEEPNLQLVRPSPPPQQGPRLICCQHPPRKRTRRPPPTLRQQPHPAHNPLVRVLVLVVPGREAADQRPYRTRCG